MKFFEDRGQAVAEQRLAHSNVQAALALREIRLEKAQLIHRPQDFIHIGHQLLARLGQNHPAPDLLKQGDRQFLLQLSDLEGDGGLRVIQFFGGLVESALIYNCPEGPQVFQFHCDAL